jgi:hypothetical protein
MDDAVAAIAASLASVKSNKRNFTARKQIDSLINSDHLGSCIDANGDGWCWIEP